MSAENTPFQPLEAPEAVVTAPGQQEIDFAEQLAQSQVPAPETTAANLADNGAETESRNPDRLMVRVAGRIAKLSEKLASTADKRTLGQTVGETTINAGIYANEQITKGRSLASRLGKNIMGKFNSGREAASRGYEKSLKVSKRVGKVALVTAGVAVALPPAAVGASLYYGGIKGAELGARAGRAVAEDVKATVNETRGNYHEARAEAAQQKAAKLQARANRKLARAKAHQTKIS